MHSCWPSTLCLSKKHAEKPRDAPAVQTSPRELSCGDSAGLEESPPHLCKIGEACGVSYTVSYTVPFWWIDSWGAQFWKPTELALNFDSVVKVGPQDSQRSVELICMCIERGGGRI